MLSFEYSYRNGIPTTVICDYYGKNGIASVCMLQSQQRRQRERKILQVLFYAANNCGNKKRANRKSAIEENHTIKRSVK